MARDKRSSDVSLGVQGELLRDLVAHWGIELVAANPGVFSVLPSNLHEALLREYIKSASNVGLAPDVVDELVAPWLGDGQAAFYRQIAQADEQFTAEIESRYGEITAPTLVVWGTADDWIPHDRARRLSESIPASQIHLIEGAGRLVQEDDPTELATTLYRWLHRSGP